jgi:hypothetical protein
MHADIPSTIVGCTTIGLSLTLLAISVYELVIDKRPDPEYRKVRSVIKTISKNKSRAYALRRGHYFPELHEALLLLHDLTPVELGSIASTQRRTAIDALAHPGTDLSVAAAYFAWATRTTRDITLINAHPYIKDEIKVFAALQTNIVPFRDDYGF